MPQVNTFKCILNVCNSGEPITEADVEQWEASNNLRFPDDYRQFLIRYNGGLVRPTTMQTADGEEISWEVANELHRHWESLDDAPSGFVQIGSDTGGNHTFICLRGYRYGKVYWADHNWTCLRVPLLGVIQHVPFLWKLFYPNLKYLAATFSEFVSQLYLSDSEYLGYLADQNDLPGLVDFVAEFGIDYRDELGDNLLSHAAWNGSFEMVKFLVDNGVDLRNSCGRAVLNQKQPVEILTYLLDNGVHPDQTDGPHAPLAVAIKKGFEDVANTLRRYGAIEPEV